MANTTGLVYLNWDMFDSPDQPGSGYKFMERETVLVLDRAIGMMQRMMFSEVIIGYASEQLAHKLGLEVYSSHKTGQAVLLRCPSPKKKWDLAKALFAQDVPRIAIQGNRLSEYLYYDIDPLKERGLFSWNFKEY